MEALEKWKVNPDICLALLDVMLPDIDGFEVCRRIRASGSKMGIIMLTAKSQEIDKVGRCTVRTRSLLLEEVPAPERRVKEKSFSVQSLRLDAVVGGLFDLSRTEAAREIAAGNVSLNYELTEKTDSPVREGDILSLRGHGKGKIIGTGGTSRKGRLFVYGERYL